MQSIFDTIRRVNEYHQEFWSARDLFKVLEYTEYNKFLPTIQKAKNACEKSGQHITEHFADVSERQKSRNQYGETLGQLLDDVYLSRYACYLIAMEADSRKGSVAHAKSYFALQTRNQEIQQQHLEDKKRVDIRKELSEHNKSLISTAKKSGVYQFGQFHDAGYQGLYNGLRAKDIKEKKGLDEKENILDHMSSEELGANLFRATQTDAKLQRDLAAGKEIGQLQAEKTHFEVGKKVRATIQELGGTMPEQLPPAEHIKYSQERLEDMAIPFEGPALTPAPTYPVPATVPELQALVQILKANPGAERVRIGNQWFKVSSAGVQLLQNFFTKQ